MSKKRLISLTILLVAFFSSSAHAWWFFFLPGSVTSAISDALTGSEGANCVSSTAKVGDKIRMPNSSIGIVKSLSGTSGRCTNSTYPIRALIEPVGESAPSPVTPSVPPPSIEFAGIGIPGGLSGADTNPNIELPYGWQAKVLPADIRAANYLFYARNDSTGAGLLVSAAKHLGFMDMEVFARTRRDDLATSLYNSRRSDVEPIHILDIPAWRFEVGGNKIYNGSDYTYLTTIVDDGKVIIEAMAFIATDKFSTNKAELSRLAYGIKGLTPPLPPPASNPNTPAAAVAPASSPPAPNAPTTTEEKTPRPETSIVTRLEVLKKLYQDGLISEKDFESKKKEILRGL